MRTRTLSCALITLTACGGTTLGGAPPGDSDAATQDAAITCGGSISFDLAVEASGRVYYGGPQPPWPGQSTCPSWLTIDHAGAALILSQGNCNHSCPAFQPEDAGARSLTWDGTYYPIVTESPPGACRTPTCAPPGEYVATFCVAAPVADASSQEGSPVCKTVSFLWPPSTANQVISETITPAPDGG